MINKKEKTMKKEIMGKLICDMHFDINNLHEDWDEGKIDDRTAIEMIANLCFFFLRALVDDTIGKIKRRKQ